MDQDGQSFIKHGVRLSFAGGQAQAQGSRLQGLGSTRLDPMHVADAAPRAATRGDRSVGRRVVSGEVPRG